MTKTIILTESQLIHKVGVCIWGSEKSLGADHLHLNLALGYNLGLFETQVWFHNVSPNYLKIVINYH